VLGERRVPTETVRLERVTVDLEVAGRDLVRMRSATTLARSAWVSSSSTANSSPPYGPDRWSARRRRLLSSGGCHESRAIDGCEFRGGVLLLETHAERAKVVAERIRHQVATRDFQIDGHPLKLTVSVGYATFPEHSTTSRGLLAAADKAMYAAKAGGRNAVACAPDAVAEAVAR